ncbi:MAG: hypothetical protein FJ293_13905 [Planctomycetes bacterium]|nr:hypothetical protein [Planctomycetota bacterium]
MSRRFLLLAAGAGLAGALALAPRPRDLRLPGAGAASLLGPLRPAVATVVRLRFEVRRRDDAVMASLADAWLALSLVPESVTDFVHYASWCLHDAPVAAQSAAERERCIEAGLAMVAAGRALHPDRHEFDWVEGRGRRRLGSAEEIAKALPLLWRAWDRAPRAPAREFLAAEFADCALVLQAGDAIAALLADPQTTPAVRETLAAAVAARPGK